MVRQSQIKSFLPWVALDSAFSLGTAILLVLVVARIIGPIAFGLASTAYLLGTFAEIFVLLPFSEALIQRRHMDTRVSDAAFVGMATAGAVAFAVLCAAAYPLAIVFEAPEIAMLILVQASTCLLLAARGVSESLMARKLRFRALAIRNIVAKLASAVVALAVALAGGGAWSIVLGNVVFAAASTIMVLVVAPRIPRFRPDAAIVRSLLRFGVFSLADGVLWTATPRLFVFLVGHYQGLLALGFLTVGFRINDAISALLAAVTSRIALPIFSRAAQRPGQLLVAFQNGSKLTAMIATPIFAGLAMVSDETIALVLGAEWAPAAPALMAISIYSLFNFARLLAPPAMKVVGRPSLLVWQHTVGLLYIGFGTVAVASLGFEAQLLVWTGFGVVYFVTSVILLRRAAAFRLRAQITPLVRPALASLGMVALLYATDLVLPDLPDWLTLLTKVVVGLVVYTTILAVLEWRFLQTILRPAEGVN